MKYDIARTSRFKKDFKLSKNRGLDIEKLTEVIEMLADGKTLPEKYKDHPLKGYFKDYRECHIEPDWLLMYKISQDTLVLTLVRTGTHSDLFE